MGLPRLKTCCFIFDLKTGNIILGCFNAILTFTMLVILITEAAMVGTINADDGEMDPEVQSAITGLYVMSILLVFLFIVKLVSDVVFIYGVVKERPGIIKSYFITWTVFFLLSLFIFFLNCYKYSPGTIWTEMLYIGVNTYDILLGYSFYKQLNVREEI
ncbi:hypothetical protein O3G_MSEX009450 [Manduca sexta]|uniref:Uncharacterized protein n=1 Tax=Manduca sexta TaxID=7130 RepID=A0A921ZE11_MANSE|nr:hypothetical protein O3G_MSEX009450 [Manduca sexta]